MHTHPNPVAPPAALPRLAAKLGTTTEEVQRHVEVWQRTQSARWAELRPRELEHYMQLTPAEVHALHLATQPRCCSY